MRSQFMNSPEDCEWLWSVHLGCREDMRPGVAFQSFVLYGNEDAPDGVDLYTARDPLVTDIPHEIHFLNGG